MVVTLFFIFDCVKNKWINSIYAIFRLLRMRNDRRLIIYLICVAIATIFWFLNALNKEYSVQLSFPVKYTNLPTNKVLSNTLPDHFSLHVNSYGFTILRHKLSLAFSPLVFDVNNFTNNRMENGKRQEYTFLSNQFIDRIAEQVSNELQITNIQPDTLFFKFDRIISKKILVAPELTYDLKRQHFLSSNITTTPDSVLVSGPESVLDTLQSVHTKNQHFKELNHTIEQEISIKTEKNLDYTPKRVILNIPVEEYTEKQLLVPVTINDLPPGMRVNLFPDKVKVNVLISLSRFPEIKPGDFRISASYQDILNNAELLNLTIESQPPYSFSVSMTPEKVEYIIEQ